MNSYTKSSKSTLIYYKLQNITATGVLNSSPIVKTDEAIKRQIHSGKPLFHCSLQYVNKKSQY